MSFHVSGANNIKDSAVPGLFQVFCLSAGSLPIFYESYNPARLMCASVRWEEEADRWKERWRKSETCRSTLRTSPLSEQLLSASWRQHCGALSTPSPTEAPVHAKQAEAALSPWPCVFCPFLSAYITAPSLTPSPPTLFLSQWSRVFVQINFKPSNVRVRTHTLRCHTLQARPVYRKEHFKDRGW